MESQTNYSKLKNSLPFTTNQDNIKLLKKDLKSKSENKHKKFHKNYNTSNEKELLSAKNNFAKFETLEEFKEKLKIDELNKKLNNFLRKKPEESQKGVLDLSSFHSLNGKSEKDAFNSFYKSRDIKTANASGNGKYHNSAGVNSLNLTAKTNFLNVNAGFFNGNMNNNNNNNNNNFNLSNLANSSIYNNSSGTNFFKGAAANNLSKFNSKLTPDFPEYIPRNIRTANTLLAGNPRKARFQSVDFNISNLPNQNKTLKNLNNNDNNNNNNNPNADLYQKQNQISNLNNLNSNTLNNNNNKDFNVKYENTAITFDDNKTFYGSGGSETKHNLAKNTNYNAFNNNNGARKFDAIKLEKEMNELIKCYLNCKDEDLEDNNFNSSSYSELLGKLQLRNISNPQEEKFVLDFLKKHKNLLDSSELYNSTFKKFSSIEKVYVNESSYKNPVSALRKLKLNKDIFNNVNEFRQQKQIDSYLDIFNEEQDKILKQMQMRKIKETDLKAFNSNEDIGEVINPIDLLHEKHDASVYNINKQLSRDQVLNYNLEFFSSNNSEFKMKPWARSSFTLNMEGNQIIMFGGISGEILYQVWVCDCKNNFSWKMMSLDEDEAPNPRYGHTACVYKKEIFIYGGYTPSDYFKPREEILIYSMTSNKFFSERAKSLKETEWRRNHIAHTVGSIMLVHGGLDDSGKTLNDTIFLEYNSLKWSKLDIRGTRSPYLSSHSSEFVLENEKFYNPNYHVYKGSNMIENTNIIKKIEFEGIYIFGGIDEDNNYKNEVYVLRVGRKPCEWIHLKIGGNPPLPRANASMNFYMNLNILILAGGKNETLKRAIFNDIFVLDLENLYWIKASTYPVQPKERTGHRAAIFNNQLLILGGNNIKKFLSMDFFMLDLDLYSTKYRDRERDRFREIDVKAKSIDKGKKAENDGQAAVQRNSLLSRNTQQKASNANEDLKLIKHNNSEQLKQGENLTKIEGNAKIPTKVAKKVSAISFNNKLKI